VGVASQATGRRVDSETLFPIFSATKGITAAALHLQAERGLVDYDAPIAAYWPQFAQHGKDRATVRDALTHRAGIPQMPEGTTPELMCNWDRMVTSIAALRPLWQPGTRCGYHAYTFGWIIGEIVRRTDPRGRPFGSFVRDELCLPLGAADLWLGIPSQLEPRIAKLCDAREAASPPPGPLLTLAIPPQLATTEEVFGRSDVRRSCHPGAGGIANARSLAAFYNLFARLGTVSGRKFLSPARVREISKCHSEATDDVLGLALRRGLGYLLGGWPTSAASAPLGANPTALGHPGAGGTIGWSDHSTGLAVAITKNKLLHAASAEDNPVVKVANAVREALGVPG
jgi:CubicO group peptidase (beta-lactamase class C family)